MKPRILVTRRIYTQAVDLLRQHADVDYNETDNALTAEQLVERAAGKQAVVSQAVDKLNAEAIGKLEGVRIIAHVGVGYDNIDVTAATRAGILVTNTPEVLTDTTADFAFALLMAAARRIVEGYRYIHGGQWVRGSIDFMVGQDVHHKTLGIIGMGRIGRAVARRGRGFEMRILYHDEGRAPEEIEQELGARYVSKEQLLRESDFVSLHVPLTESTQRLIGEAELRMMKSSAILINTSRGKVMDEAAVAQALAERWIAGAGLDVFENEPKVHPLLLRLDNVVITPHIASASVDTRREMSLLAARNAVAALQGRRPETLLNPELWDSATARRGVSEAEGPKAESSQSERY